MQATPTNAPAIPRQNRFFGGSEKNIQANNPAQTGVKHTNTVDRMTEVS